MTLVTLLLVPVALIVWAVVTFRRSKQQSRRADAVASSGPHRTWTIAVRGIGLALGAVMAFGLGWAAIAAPDVRLWVCSGSFPSCGAVSSHCPWCSDTWP